MMCDKPTQCDPHALQLSSKLSSHEQRAYDQHLSPAHVDGYFLVVKRPAPYAPRCHLISTRYDQHLSPAHPTVKQKFPMTVGQEVGFFQVRSGDSVAHKDLVSSPLGSNGQEVGVFLRLLPSASSFGLFQDKAFRKAAARNLQFRRRWDQSKARRRPFCCCDTAPAALLLL